VIPAPPVSKITANALAAGEWCPVEVGADRAMADESLSTAGPLSTAQSPAMGPSIRPFAYRRDPWWDAGGRVARRRRRRRLVAWSVLVGLAVTIGALAGELRVAFGS
jgi:hypothetical protein